MKKYKDYESVSVEIVYFNECDVIATSTPTNSDNIGGDGRYDTDGWT